MKVLSSERLLVTDENSSFDSEHSTEDDSGSWNITHQQQSFSIPMITGDKQLILLGSNHLPITKSCIIFLQLIFMQEQSVSYRLPLTMLLRMMLERPWRFSWSWEGVWKKEITNTEPPCKWLLNWVCCCTGIRSNNSKVLSAIIGYSQCLWMLPPPPKTIKQTKTALWCVACSRVQVQIVNILLYPIYSYLRYL